MSSGCINKKRKIVVHNGKFHADDVMACAIMKCINPEIEIIRTNKITKEMAEDDSAVIADIGYGEYDHHQENAKKHNSEIDNKYMRTGTGAEYKKAACGLLFDKVKDDLFPAERYAKKFEKEVIRPIEKQDNGGQKLFGNPFSIMISGLNPTWDSEESENQAFEKAVEICQVLLMGEVRKAKSEYYAEKYIKNIIANSKESVVVLDRYIPWREGVKGTSIKYVVYPGERGYNLAPTKGTLPKEWMKNKPAGCNFVHSALFLATFNKVETARKAAKTISSDGSGVKL